MKRWYFNVPRTPNGHRSRSVKEFAHLTGLRAKCVWLNRHDKPAHWREFAIDRGPGPWPADWLLGEDDDGELYAPSLVRVDWWDRRYSPKDPFLWRYWLLSRLTRRVLYLETQW